jgi:hypothetical protein
MRPTIRLSGAIGVGGPSSAAGYSCTMMISTTSDVDSRDRKRFRIST